MSEVAIKLPGSTRSGSDITAARIYPIDAAGTATVTVSNFDQRRLSQPTGSFFIAVSQSILGIVQSAVTSTSQVFVPIALASATTTWEAQDIADFYGERAQQFSSFESIYVQETNYGFDCITVLSNATDEDYFALYNLELELRDEALEDEFYFEIIDRGDVLLEEIRSVEIYDGVFKNLTHDAKH